MEYPEPTGMSAECQKTKVMFKSESWFCRRMKEGSAWQHMQTIWATGQIWVLLSFSRDIVHDQVASSSKPREPRAPCPQHTHPSYTFLSAFCSCPPFTGGRNPYCTDFYWPSILLHLVFIFYFWDNLYFGEGEASIAGRLGEQDMEAEFLDFTPGSPT